MAELYTGIVGFFLGIFSHILYHKIDDIRRKRKVKQALYDEIEANFFQIRDGRNYAAAQKMNLNRFRKGHSFVVNDYKFSYAAYESSIMDIPLLKRKVSMKIHHL